MSYNPGNPFPPLSDRSERTLRSAPITTRWVSVGGSDPWTRHGACVGNGVDDMFPENKSGEARAKKLCLGCPVLSECLSAAMADPTLDGVWGGTTLKERDHQRHIADKRAEAEALRRKRAEIRQRLNLH